MKKPELIKKRVALIKQVIRGKMTAEKAISKMRLKPELDFTG